MLLFRMMIFSIMFGCGTSWFITLQSMSEEAFLPVFLTSTACMAMSFFGTVASVLGYFLELENFDEALDVINVFVGAFPIFAITAGVSQFSLESAHPFGIGGWLSTYVAVNGIVTLGFSIVLRSRPVKNNVTRGVSNSSCLLSWICWIVVLYGRYGVAGLDASYDVTTMFGFPASVMGTFAASLILLLLEGESAQTGRAGRGRRTMGSSSTAQTAAPWLCVNLKSLNAFNCMAPPVASISVVLLLGTVYAIFTRGCGLLDVATSHSDVFDNIFGKGSGGVDDLATLAEKNMIHSSALMTSAKLAGASFWTAPNLMGPLLHTFGLCVVSPSLWFFVNHLWGNHAATNASLVTLCAPLNLIALFVCRGIPTLRAAGMVGFVGGILQVMNLRGRDHQSKMRI
mmetsp:Transcript_39222/g.55188  ORF Transcript_39222/g.55188 Transcript_39222/m.55188 type:complete len:399 (+) Transcript_39222:756-1952(+)